MIDYDNDGAGSAGPRRIRPSRIGSEDAAGLHRPSHLDLISPVPHYGMNEPAIRLSAVVVPTHRAAGDAGDGLGLAARLAEANDAQLIILRSAAAARTPFPQDLIPATSGPTAVVDLSERAWCSLPPLLNGQHVVATRNRRSDIAGKRNLALLIGQLCRWDSVLMLDDDISLRRSSQLPRVLDSAGTHPFLRLDDVLSDFAANPRLRAAGFLQKDFDDNSVVCHARRLAGHPQAGFISGGALVVRCGGRPPFFPSAYNEDWLFFFCAMLEGRHSHPTDAIKYVGTVHQSPYQPFSVSRARSEELGDVLAEGLFALLDTAGPDLCAIARSRRYWQEIIWRRQDMILDLIQEFRSRRPGPGQDQLAQIDDALRAALGVYEGPRGRWAAALAQYFDLLMLDLSSWHRHLDTVTPASSRDVLSVPEALARLGLTTEVSWYQGRRARPALWSSNQVRARQKASLHCGGHGPGAVVDVELGEGA